MNKKHLLDEALRLRIKERLSLREISIKLNIAQSTASLWLKDYPLSPEEILAKQKEYNATPEAKRILARATMRSVEATRKSDDEPQSWGSLRRKIFSKRGRVCEVCGWREANPFTGIVPVQIDHVNGDPLDNRLENLIVLCPNCHALTEHFMFYGRSHKGAWGKKGTRRYR